MVGAAAFLCVFSALAFPLTRPAGLDARGYAAVPGRMSDQAATQTVSMPSWPPSTGPAQKAPASPALAALIQTLGQQFAGHVGIAVKSVDQGWTVAWNGDELFPQQSVSKLWVAMTMFDAIDRGKVTLDTQVMIRPQDLTLFHQPVAAMVRGDGYQTTLNDLFTRAMTESDNTANDSVLRTVGGSDAVRAFLARRFIANIRFGPGERLLQSKTAGLEWTQDMAMGRRFYAARSALPRSVREKALDDYLADPMDGAAPLSIVNALAKLKRGEMLSPTSTQLLLETMGDAKTGPKRVKGGVPAGWHYVHKTGTGQELYARSTGYNDVGIMTGPDGSSYAIAVMIGSTTLPIPKRWELMQSVARAVAALHQPQPGIGGGTFVTSLR
ncbi:MAG: serine hydrolase [Sphingobium sp.]|nr:serine hydrolase [Sphingobium sp.]